jgi:hypothetical protein
MGKWDPGMAWSSKAVKRYALSTHLCICSFSCHEMPPLKVGHDSWIEKEGGQNSECQQGTSAMKGIKWNKLLMLLSPFQKIAIS